MSSVGFYVKDAVSIERDSTAVGASEPMNFGTILLVEPNPGVLVVARNVLTLAGYTVLAVPSVDQAVPLAEEGRIDAAIVDAHLAESPLMTALFAHLRVPVILTFERGRPIDEPTDTDQTMPGVAAAELLEKPFTPDRLRHSVERVLADRAPPSADGDFFSFPTLSDDDLFENDKTDILTFSHEQDGGQRDPARSWLFAEHLKTFLEVEGVAPHPALLSACLRACDAVMAPASELQRPRREGEGQPAIQGVIPELSIDQVLQLAMAVGQPSRCRIARGSACVELYYQGESVVFARQTGLPHGFRLGPLIMAAGLIDEATMLRVLDDTRPDSFIGRRLVALRHVRERELARALRRQAEELVYEVVRWSEGRFAIFSDVTLPEEARSAKVKVPVPHLLIEGMRRLDEWRRIQPKVGELASVVARAPGSSNLAPNALSLDEREVLRHLDDRRTVAELVDRVARPTFQVYRTLSSLVDRRLVTVSG